MKSTITELKRVLVERDKLFISSHGRRVFEMTYIWPFDTEVRIQSLNKQSCKTGGQTSGSS